MMIVWKYVCSCGTKYVNRPASCVSCGDRGRIKEIKVDEKDHTNSVERRRGKKHTCSR